MLLKLALTTVALIILGLIPLVGLPGAFVLMVSIPGLLIFDVMAGINGFNMISGPRLWPFAIYLTIIGPTGIVPAYLISKQIEGSGLPLPLQLKFSVLMILWCNLCTVALLSCNPLSSRAG